MVVEGERTQTSDGVTRRQPDISLSLTEILDRESLQREFPRWTCYAGNSTWDEVDWTIVCKDERKDKSSQSTLVTAVSHVSTLVGQEKEPKRTRRI